MPSRPSPGALNHQPPVIGPDSNWPRHSLAHLAVFCVHPLNGLGLQWHQSGHQEYLCRLCCNRQTCRPQLHHCPPLELGSGEPSQIPGGSACQQEWHSTSHKRPGLCRAGGLPAPCDTFPGWGGCTPTPEQGHANACVHTHPTQPQALPVPARETKDRWLAGSWCQAAIWWEVREVHAESPGAPGIVGTMQPVPSPGGNADPAMVQPQFSTSCPASTSVEPACNSAASSGTGCRGPQPISHHPARSGGGGCQHASFLLPGSRRIQLCPCWEGGVMEQPFALLGVPRRSVAGEASCCGGRRGHTSRGPSEASSSPCCWVELGSHFYQTETMTQGGGGAFANFSPRHQPPRSISALQRCHRRRGEAAQPLYQQRNMFCQRCPCSCRVTAPLARQGGPDGDLPQACRDPESIRGQTQRTGLAQHPPPRWVFLPPSWPQQWVSGAEGSTESPGLVARAGAPIPCMHPSLPIEAMQQQVATAPPPPGWPGCFAP